MSKITQEVGQSIKAARLAEGLTQKQAGELMGVSEATFNKYETGKQNLTLDTLQKIAEALHARLSVTLQK